MTHLSNRMAQARKNNRFQNGNAGRVREAIAHSIKPLSVYKLQLYTGLDADQVRHALCHLMQAGGIVSELGPKNVTFYKLRKPAPKSQGSGQIAGPITIPCYRWGSTRLG